MANIGCGHPGTPAARRTDGNCRPKSRSVKNTRSGGSFIGERVHNLLACRPIIFHEIGRPPRLSDRQLQQSKRPSAPKQAFRTTPEGRALPTWLLVCLAAAGKSVQPAPCPIEFCAATLAAPPPHPAESIQASNQMRWTLRIGTSTTGSEAGLSRTEYDGAPGEIARGYAARPPLGSGPPPRYARQRPTRRKRRVVELPASWFVVRISCTT